MSATASSAFLSIAVTLLWETCSCCCEVRSGVEVRGTVAANMVAVGDSCSDPSSCSRGVQSVDKSELHACALFPLFNELGELTLPSLKTGLETEWWLQLGCSFAAVDELRALCLLLDLSCCRSLLSSERERGDSEDEKVLVKAGLDFHVLPVVPDEK